jgi:hypothetical protein
MPHSHSRTTIVIWMLIIWGHYFHFVKCDLAVSMQELLDNCGEFAVPNYGHNFGQLAAWHKCQQIEPILRRELTELMSKNCKF